MIVQTFIVVPLVRHFQLAALVNLVVDLQFSLSICLFLVLHPVVESLQKLSQLLYQRQLIQEVGVYNEDLECLLLLAQKVLMET